MLALISDVFLEITWQYRNEFIQRLDCNINFQP